MKRKSPEVKKLREKLGLTQVEFAARLGVNPITISRWERGICRPSKLALTQIECLATEDRRRPTENGGPRSSVAGRV